jgi:methionyl-tRNA formyltransferase
MRIVFMGTPDFAAASLRALYDAGHVIVGVFTQPDRPKSRGMKLTESPVKRLALSRGTPVFQPSTLRDGTALQTAESLAPDLIVAVAYGKILPQAFLDLPPCGAINIHGSILPKYRGAAPIQWAILNGERKTGVTAMYMAPEMDAGDVIAVKETPIGEDETSGELFGRLAALGAELLLETVRDIGNGTAVRTAQDHAAATYAPPIQKTLCPIDWTKTAQEIKNQVRGLNPWPVATASIGGEPLKIHRVKVLENTAAAPAGAVLSADGDGIVVACGQGAVSILELQAAGGRRMQAGDYLRGHPICV